MFNKIVIFILFSLINSTLEYTPIQLEKYGSITCSQQRVFYLSLDGFKSGDTLYFEGSFTNDFIFKKIPLYFLESDSLEYYKRSDFESVFSNSYSQIGANVIYYLSYTLKKNNKYLLIVTPNFDPYFINFNLSMKEK